MGTEYNRQLAGLDDITWGVGTEQQDRNGVSVTVTKINAANMPYDETQTLEEKIEGGDLDGQSIDHVSLTTGDSSPGSTDVYTVWGDVGETINIGTFDVYNGTTGPQGIQGIQGIQGQSVDHTSLTTGDSSPGSTDVYTVWGDVGETINMGTFDVYNGADGDLTTVTSTSVFSGLGTAASPLDLSTDVKDLQGYFNGNAIDEISGAIVYDGVTVKVHIEKIGGGDIRLKTSTGVTIFSSTPAVELELTVGTDAVPVLNYVFIPESTNVLTANTTGFPAVNLVQLAKILVQSAASAQADGVLLAHRHTDHITSHGSHINDWIRSQNATYLSGAAISFIGSGTTAITTELTSGKVKQLHTQTFPAIVSPADIYVVNDSVVPFKKIDDLASITLDSTGATLVGRTFALVIYGVVSETGLPTKLYLNLPSGSEGTNRADKIREDKDKEIDYSIYEDFKGSGFLIHRLVMDNNAGTLTIYEGPGDDLRGQFPNTASGSSTTVGTEFPDGAFKLTNTTDVTKVMTFDASLITTGNTRTLVIPDKAGTLALLGDVAKNIAANSTAYGYTVKPSNEKTDRWLEVDVADTIVDKFADSVRHLDGLYSRLGTEKVTNGDFADGSTGWTFIGDNFSVANGIATILDNGGNQDLLQDYSLVDGTTYRIEVYIDSVTGDIPIRQYTGSTRGTTIATISSTGLQEFIFTADSTGSSLTFVTGSGENLAIGLASVKELPQVELEEAPFAGSTDELIATGDTLTNDIHNSGDIVIAEDNPNDIYQCTVDATAIDTDITAGGSFQTIDRVTRHDPILLTKTGMTSFKGIHIFGSEDTTDTMATTLGYSKLGNGLYHNGTEEVVIVGYQVRLNALGKHAAYNSLGRAILDGSTKEGLDTTATSLYDCASGTLTGGTIASGSSGSSDGTKFDKFYFEGYGGLVFIPTYSQKQSESDLLNDGAKSLLVYDEMAISSGIETIQRNQELASATQITVAVLNSEPEPIVGGNIYHNSLARIVKSYIDDATNWVITLDSTMAILVAEPINYTTKNSSLTTQGKSLRVKAVCDYQYSPADWKSHLAAGNGIDIEYDMINVNTDASQLPEGIIDDFLVSSKIESASTSGDLIYDTGAGTWGAGTTDIIASAANTITSTNLPADDISLSSFTAYNSPLIFDDLTDYEEVVDSTYLYAADTNNAATDMATAINAVTGKISVGTDDTEKLGITKVIAGVITHIAETLTEDALVSFALFVNTTSNEYYIGCYFATDGVIDKADGAYIKRTGAYRE